MNKWRSDDTHLQLTPESAEQLRAYVRTLGELEEALFEACRPRKHKDKQKQLEVRAELNARKSEVYGEAQACGFDRRVLKLIVDRMRLKDPDLELKLLMVYEQAIYNPEETDYVLP